MTIMSSAWTKMVSCSCLLKKNHFRTQSSTWTLSWIWSWHKSGYLFRRPVPYRTIKKMINSHCPCHFGKLHHQQFPDQARSWGAMWLSVRAISCTQLSRSPSPAMLPGRAKSPIGRKCTFLIQRPLAHDYQWAVVRKVSSCVADSAVN